MFFQIKRRTQNQIIMKTVRTILIVALAVTSVTASAQYGRHGSSSSFSLGAKTGLNFAWVTSETPEGFKGVPATGLQLGAVANFGVNENFSIQPELLFSQKGYKIRDDGTTPDVSYSSSLTKNYVEIPVLAKVTFGNDNSNARVFLNAGPYIGIWATGKMKSRYSYEGDSDTDIELINFHDYDYVEDGVALNRVDLGLSFGGGVAIAAGPGSFLLDVRYNIGLSDQMRYVNKKEIKESYLEDGEHYKSTANRSVGLSVGYAFSL